MHYLDVVLPITVTIALTLIHFVGERISQRMRKWHFHLESLGAGLMVGILFLELLPQIFVGINSMVSEGIAKASMLIYIPLLAGFTVIALTEKIVYKRLLQGNPTTPIKLHSHSDSEPHNEAEQIIETTIEYEKDIAEIECIVPEHNALFEAIALVTHGLMIGIIVSLIFSENPIDVSFIIMIPFVIRAFTISFSAEQIMEDLKEKPMKVFRILSFTLPTLGAIIGAFLVLNTIAFFIVYAFALGLVLFGVIRDLIPLGKKGKPLFFLLGIIFTIGIFLLNELVLH